MNQNKQPHNMIKGDKKTFPHLGALDEFAENHECKKDEFAVTLSKCGGFTITKQ